MQELHTSTIYRQAERVHGAIVRITILHMHRCNSVAEPYPEREGEYISSRPPCYQAGPCIEKEHGMEQITASNHKG